MCATLYVPKQLPKPVSIEGLVLPILKSKSVPVPEQVSALLGCAPGLVDVLVSDSNYVVYSVFDYEGDINHAAMTVLSELTGVRFGEDEDDTLRGTVLVVEG